MPYKGKSVVTDQGWIQNFLRGDMNIEVISEAGVYSPPEDTGCFSNIHNTKACLMQDLEHI